MMTSDEKLDMLSVLLNPSNEEAEKLEVYLQMAEKEILAWRYSYTSEKPETVPEEYEMTQIHAVIAGFNVSGAEGQATHSENGISRTFNYPDMLHYIHRNVVHKVGVL
jgi:hypothetical protein